MQRPKGLSLEAIPCCRVEEFHPIRTIAFIRKLENRGAKPMDLPQRWPLTGGNNTLNRFNPFLKAPALPNLFMTDPIQEIGMLRPGLRFKRDSTIVNGYNGN